MIHRLIPCLVLSAAGSGSALAQVTTYPPAGRLLAANCFQCHGTNGRAVSGFEKLSGKSAAEIAKEMTEMKAEATAQPGEKGIMGVHALGYNDAQIKAIANYFASQR